MKFEVAVVRDFVVTLDPTKFDEKFLREFRETFYDFHSLQEHAEHLAQMFARGLYDCGDPHVFVEGYGKLSEAGVTVTEDPKTITIEAMQVQS